MTRRGGILIIAALMAFIALGRACERARVVRKLREELVARREVLAALPVDPGASSGRPPDPISPTVTNGDREPSLLDTESVDPSRSSLQIDRPHSTNEPFVAADAPTDPWEFIDIPAAVPPRVRAVVTSRGVSRVRLETGGGPPRWYAEGDRVSGWSVQHVDLQRVILLRLSPLRGCIWTGTSEGWCGEG